MGNSVSRAKGLFYSVLVLLMALNMRAAIPSVHVASYFDLRFVADSFTIGLKDFSANTTTGPTASTTTSAPPTVPQVQNTTSTTLTTTVTNTTTTSAPATTILEFNTTFSESGLPPNTIWAVKFAGLRRFSRSGSVNFTTPSGNYSFSIANVYVASSNHTYIPYVQSGAAPAGSYIAIIFSFLSPSTTTTVSSTTTQQPGINTTFSEGGLPKGTIWSVTFDGTKRYSGSGSMNFTTTAGNYSFTVANVYVQSSNETYIPYARSGAAPAGSSIAILFTFQSPPTTTTVATTTTQQPTVNTTFSESGLPANTIWAVTFVGTRRFSGTRYINFTTPSGNYSFSVPNVSVASQNQTYYPYVQSGMAPSGSTISISFSYQSPPTTTTVTTTTTTISGINTTFTEGGLPANTIWAVAFAGLRRYSGARSMNFTTQPGNYSFTVANVYIAATNTTYLSYAQSGTAPANSVVAILFTPQASVPQSVFLRTFNVIASNGIARKYVEVNSSETAFDFANYSLTRITAVTKPGLSNLNISVATTPYAPPDSAPLFGSTYQYIHINESAYNTTTGSSYDADPYIQNVTYNFSVPISWVNSHGGNEGGVLLYKYTNGWGPLSTVSVGENSTDYFYSAVSDSFSTYAIGYVSGTETATTANLLLTMPSGQETYFFVFAGVSSSKSGTTAITNTYNLTAANIVANAVSARTTAPTFINVIVIGHNSVLPSNTGARTGNFVFKNTNTGPMYNVIIAGFGANVLIPNNAVFGRNSINSGANDVLTYNVPPADSSSLVLLLFGSGGALFNSISTPTLPSGCSQVSMTSMASNVETEIANCIESSSGNPYTLSFNTLPLHTESLAEAVYVFPPYFITFNDVPTTGNIVQDGVTMPNNGVANIIGTIPINVVLPVTPGNYVFNSIIAASQSANYIVSPSNFIIANAVSGQTFITIMGNGIVTALWNSITINDVVSNGLVDGNQLQTLTANIVNSNGIRPFTFNFLVYGPTGVLVNNALFNSVTTETNTFTFVQQPSWGTGAFTANVLVSDWGGYPGTTVAAFNGLKYGANAPLQSTGFTVSNALIDQNQLQTLTATVAGGTETNSISTGYTYNFLVYGPTGTLVDNGLFIGKASVSNTFTFIQSPSWGTGGFTTNIIVYDSANSVANVVANTATYGTNAVFTSSSFTANNPATGSLQLLSATVAGGTETNSISTGYTYNFLVYGPTGTLVDNALFVGQPSVTNTFAFVQNPLWGSFASFTANIIVMDSASTPNTVVNSLTYSSYPFSANVGYVSGDTLTSPLGLTYGYGSYYLSYGSGKISCGAGSPTVSWANDTHEGAHEPTELCSSENYGENFTAIGNQASNTATFSGSGTQDLSGIGANVIFNNGQVFAESTTGAASYPFTVWQPGSFAILAFSTANDPFNSLPALPAGCLAQQTISTTYGESEMAVCNTISSSGTLSLASIGSTYVSVAAYVFPPYNVIFNESPGAGNAMVSTTTLSNGGLFNAIGSFTINAIAPTTAGNYLFSQWSPDTANAANFSIASPTSANTFLTIMGNGIITATWNALVVTDSVSNSLIDADQLQNLTATTNGIAPFTYNFLVYGPTGTLVDNALFSGVTAPTNTFTFVQQPSWGTGGFTVNLILTDIGGSGYVAVFNGLTYGANAMFRSTAWSASNTLIDQNQLQTLTATVAGGTETNSTSTGYTYNFLVYGPTGTILDNALFIGQPSVTNTFTFVQQPSWGTGRFTANIMVNDSATTPNTVVNSISYGVNTIFQSTLWTAPSPAIEYTLQTITANLAGGTVTNAVSTGYTYDYIIYNSIGKLVVSAALVQSSASNTYGFLQSPAWGIGSFTANLVAMDSATSVPNVVVNSLVYTVSPLTITDAVSNALVDADQLQTLTATTNGVQPFTYNFLVYGPTGTLVDNALFTSVSTATNTFTFVQQPSWGTGAFTVNLVFTDKEGSSNTVSFNGLTYGANALFRSTAWSASNTLIDANQLETLTATVAGGTETNSVSTGYTYNYIVYNSIGTIVANELFIGKAAVTNTFTFVQNAMWSNGIFTANIMIVDSASTPNTVVNSLTYGANSLFFSNSLTVEVNPITPGQLQTIFTSVGGGTSSFNFNILVYNSVRLVASSNSPFSSSTTNTFTYTQNSAWGSGPFTVNVIYTDSASSSANVITNSTSYTISTGCTAIVSTGTIGFGSLAPLGSTATSNQIVDTNTGGAAANVYVYGSNWVYGSSNFFVANTLWNPSSQSTGVGNNLILGIPIPTDTHIYLPANTGTAQSNSIYFGLHSIPAAQQAGAYTQNIVVENYC